MAQQQKGRVTREVFLENVRLAWWTLEKPDYKFAALGVYGVGVKLDEKTAHAVNDAVRKVGEDSGEIGKTYHPGDVLKLNMDAARRDRKTGDLVPLTPQVWLPNLLPAEPKDVAQITRNTRVTAKIRISSYSAIGNPGEDGKPGGISIKFAGLQIVEFDAGEPSASEQGFTAVSRGEVPF